MDFIIIALILIATYCVLATLYIVKTVKMFSKPNNEKESFKYYSLFDPAENNQIGTISCTKNEDLKPLIEAACTYHFDEVCTIDQKAIDKEFHLLSKCPTITLEVQFDSGNSAEIELAETWMYCTDDLEK